MKENFSKGCEVWEDVFTYLTCCSYIVIFVTSVLFPREKCATCATCCDNDLTCLDMSLYIFLDSSGGITWSEFLVCVRNTGYRKGTWGFRLLLKKDSLVQIHVRWYSAHGWLVICHMFAANSISGHVKQLIPRYKNFLPEGTR